ncbi:hypothetical protein SPSE_0688 [Staphylococcus pseudintermedius ED99]|nr:hypothetical protein SPSE_0688 [Staphylococcus pseudintermedius ED99]
MTFETLNRMAIEVDYIKKWIIFILKDCLIPTIKAYEKARNVSIAPSFLTV